MSSATWESPPPLGSEALQNLKVDPALVDHQKLIPLQHSVPGLINTHPSADGTPTGAEM